jgi:hypothetical protein
MPGYEPGVCGDACGYDPDAVRAAFAEWRDAGNEPAEPLRIQHSDAGDDVRIGKIIVADLQAVGIDAEDVTVDGTTSTTTRPSPGSTRASPAS